MAAVFVGKKLQVANCKIAGPALAVDAPDAKGAVESIKNALPNPFFGRSDNVNQGPTVCDCEGWAFFIRTIVRPCCLFAAT